MLAAVIALTLAQQCPECKLSWATEVKAYGDNTEFFTPYRTGETILGASVLSFLRMTPGEKTELRVGFHADHRSGSDQFAHPFRPVITFEYHNEWSKATIGTIVPERRHGYIEPLQVTTLELTRPLEYGLQWQVNKSVFSAETFINWQALNTPDQREKFDYGFVAKVKPVRLLELDAQLHGVHSGGQLYNAGEPVANNVAKAFGATLGDQRLSLRAMRASAGGGSGTYLRAATNPFGWLEVFGILWKGKDYISQEGDFNYNSIGRDPTYYKADREYIEVGFLRRTHIEKNITFDAELRFHQFDGGVKSISLADSRWEYSYRFIVNAPFEFPIR